jgi:hypothetical protein
MAFGQQRDRTSRSGDRVSVVKTVRSTTGMRKASSLIGSRVITRDETRIGKVTDFIINDAGCIEYLVASYRSDYILIPWRVATVNYQERFVSLRLTSEKLRQVPSFREDRWPDLSDTGYTRRLHRYWGVEERDVDRAKRTREGEDKRRFDQEVNPNKKKHPVKRGYRDGNTTPPVPPPQ